MNKILYLYTLLNIINVECFIICKFFNKNHITNLLSKKSNKFKNMNNNIDYFDDEFYNIDYNTNTNTNTNTITNSITNSIINTKLNKIKYEPKGVNQENYVEYLNNKNISLIFAIGPAGSGKTLFACINAIKSLKSKSINKIILTRPIVAVEDEEIGFLPGNLQHKMDPWTKPIFDIFLEYFKQYEIDHMIKESIIEICPLSFMRGRTFKNSIIICDEMQNSTPLQMLMLLTRIGDESKMIITGDLLQSDRIIDNGLSDVITKIEEYKLNNDLDNIKIIQMTQSDIQRSNLVKDILNIYNR